MDLASPQYSVNRGEDACLRTPSQNVLEKLNPANVDHAQGFANITRDVSDVQQAVKHLSRILRNTRLQKPKPLKEYYFDLIYLYGTVVQQPKNTVHSRHRKPLWETREVFFSSAEGQEEKAAVESKGTDVMVE